MQINQIQRNTKRSKSRQVGRGGKRGKTSGRGHKGQKQHGGHGIRPHMRDVIKKLPKLRGRGKNSNKSIQDKPQVVNLSDIESVYKTGETVNPDTLLANELIIKKSGKIGPVKVLGNGELTKKVTVEGCEISKSVEEKVKKAGGSIIVSKVEGEEKSK